MTATILFLFGLSLALLTLRDVIDTVVVPGRTGGLLSVLRRIIRLSLPLWRAARRREQGVSTSFAPFALVQAFVVWMLLLTFGFGLMVRALASSFEPALPSFGQALFVAGSGLVTVGLSETDATGLARWVVMSSGFFGLAVVTLAVTYLLQVQGATSSRDAGILKLTTSAGRPPSGWRCWSATPRSTCWTTCRGCSKTPGIGAPSCFRATPPTLPSFTSAPRKRRRDGRPPSAP